MKIHKSQDSTDCCIDALLAIALAGPTGIIRGEVESLVTSDTHYRISRITGYASRGTWTAETGIVSRIIVVVINSTHSANTIAIALYAIHWARILAGSSCLIEDKRIVAIEADINVSRRTCLTVRNVTDCARGIHQVERRIAGSTASVSIASLAGVITDLTESIVDD